MEENKNRGRGFGVVNFSVVLSFVVAFFAIVSLATFGIVSNQGMDAVSYAAPTGTTTGNSFTFSYKDADGNRMALVGYKDSTNTFEVPMYSVGGDPTKPVFCVEHAIDPPGHNTEVDKDGAIEDYGLLYILLNSYTNGNPRTTADTSIAEADRPMVEEWITQVAIWKYLNETNGGAAHKLTAEEVDVIEHVVRLDYTNVVSSRTIYQGEGLYPYVDELVTEAKKVSGNKLLAVVVEDKAVSKTTDEKFYQSAKISVHGNPDRDLQTFDIALSGIDGAILVDEDGKTMEPNGIAKGKAFYVRVPVDKVKSETQRLNITATGHFNTLAGNYFVSDENGEALQKVITVTGTTRDVIAGNHVDFVGVPDSGMNTAQTIYFIGLIVLLCGVGIVYANAKPVGQKQQ